MQFVFYALVGIRGNPGPAPLPDCRYLPPPSIPGSRGAWAPADVAVSGAGPTRTCSGCWLTLVWSFLFFFLFTVCVVVALLAVAAASLDVLRVFNFREFLDQSLHTVSME